MKDTHELFVTIFGNSRKLKLVNGRFSKSKVQSDSFKYLGAVINQTMSWSEHIDTISTKINQRIGMIKRIRHLFCLYMLSQHYAIPQSSH